MLRAQNELWTAQNQTETCPQELWASDLEALEVSGAPRGDQESLKEVCKSPQIMIYGVCRVIMSRQGAAGSPRRAPKELLESPNDVRSSLGDELHKLLSCLVMKLFSMLICVLVG